MAWSASGKFFSLSKVLPSFGGLCCLEKIFAVECARRYPTPQSFGLKGVIMMRVILKFAEKIVTGVIVRFVYDGLKYLYKLFKDDD